MDHYRLASRGENDGLWDWNLVSNLVHFAPRWVAMVGCEEHEVGRSPDEWLKRVHAEDRHEVEREIDAHLQQGPTEFTVHHRMLHKDGTYRWMVCHAVIVRDEAGRAIRMMGSHADVTGDRVTDAVTGLPNRLLFEDRLSRAIEHARRHPEFLFAVLLLDLDRADPQVGAGTGAADPLMTAAARRLETCLRGGEAPASLGHEYVVSRVRADQFGILLEGLAHVAEARTSAQKVLAEMLAPFSTGGREVFAQASIGIAVSATGYARPADVLRDADIALHRAHSLGRGRCEVFDTAILDSAQNRLEMETELERALEQREFVLHYQPIVSMASNRIAGFEALVRWEHPSRGLIPPLEFVPLAEKTGLITRLGAWVVREACRQLADWQATLKIPRDVWVSVNLSGTQFKQPLLFDQIAEAVRDAPLEPACLMVELTESIVMENPAAAKGLIMQLRVMGVRVGLDDFGTGHSSLAYLHQFPADFLKVDRSFIRGLESRQEMADILRTVNTLAEQLGLEVIAEGIETHEQFDVVRALRCDYVQGFLLSRPLPRERAEERLKAGLEISAERPPAVASGVEPPAAPAPLPAADAARARRPRALALAGVALAGLLVVVGVFAARTVFRPSPPPAPTTASSSPVVQQAAPAVATPSGIAADAASGTPTPLPGAVVPASQQQTAPPVEKAAATPRAEGSPNGAVTGTTTRPRTERATAATKGNEVFPVEHQHVIGSCSGMLVVSSYGVTFVPDKSNDGFIFKHQAFAYTLSGDSLAIRSAGRAYHFKAARATGKADGQARLQKVVDSLARFATAR